MRVGLAIGGLDPSSGAGIVADARAMRAAGIWPCTVAAALTVQSTRGVRGVHAVAAGIVQAQLAELERDLDIAVVKLGALGSAENMRVATTFVRRIRAHVVVDPVSLPSRGKVNLQGDYNVKAMRRLASCATLVTPNLPEAEDMLSTTIEFTDARDAAVTLRRQLGCRAVLLKGGHARGAMVTDWLATKRQCVRLQRKRVSGSEVHGTGCVLASLIAGRMAATKLSDAELLASVRWATGRLSRIRRRALKVGQGMAVLDHGGAR